MNIFHPNVRIFRRLANNGYTQEVSHFNICKKYYSSGTWAHMHTNKFKNITIHINTH